MIDYFNAIEAEVHLFVTEASTIDIAPGAPAPAFLETKLGNKQPFMLQSRAADGTLRYLQQFGCLRLHVLND